MILLKNLKLRNFLSHEKTEITFNTNQKMLVDGNSGSGKTAILEAIIWAFYGTGRSSNSALIRRGTDKAEVTLTLDNDGTEVVLQRSVNKSKHTLTIMIDGVSHAQTGVRELQAWIETELTGASYALFVNSIAYLQGGAESFVGQNAGARKELLLEIVKTIDFETYYEKAKKRMGEIELELAVIDSDIASCDARVNEATENLKRKPTVQETIKQKEATGLAYEEERNTLLKQLEGREDRQAKIHEKKTEIDMLNTEKHMLVKTIRDTQAQIDSKASDLATPPEDVEALQKERDELHTKLEGVRESITSLARVTAERTQLLQAKPTDGRYLEQADAMKKEIEEMGSANDCKEGESCPNFAATLERIKGKRETVANYESLDATYRQELAEWETKFNATSEVSVDALETSAKSMNVELATLDGRIKAQENRDFAQKQVDRFSADIASDEGKLEGVEGKLAGLQLELGGLEKHGDSEEETKALLRCDELAGLIAINTSARDDAQRELGVLEAYEASIPEQVNKKQELVGKKNAHEKNLQYLQLLKEAFGSKGIKSMVIDYLIPELEEKINEILSQMSEFRVLLDTQQEKASGDGSKEGLFITIVNDMGEEMPFENYSGGEKLKIVVAITEALATLQKCGFRLFDETWVGLDEVSLESFSHVLDTLLERFPQVVCVSHLTEIKAAFEDKVTITKHNGVSHAGM